MAALWIKLCGMMRPQDADRAAALGASAIGMILHAQAKRRIDIALARSIISAAQGRVQTVGVCVDADLPTLLDLKKQTGVDLLQLHGQETPDTVAGLGEIPVVKAIRVDPASIESTMAPWIERRRHLPNLRALLLESAGQHAGGSGVVNDFELIAELCARGVFGDYPLIIAGGLNFQNVGPVVKQLNPYGVDTSSGIEEALGQKSDQLMREFILQAQQARG